MRTYQLCLILLFFIVTNSSCTRKEEILIRDIPQNIGVVNAYKKAHQFSDIRWSPIDYIPTVSDAKGFIPNVKYKGLWYSSAKEPNKFIGYDLSLITAMTALNNPYSLLYTEDILGSRCRSKYGYRWNGINCGAYMGVVCSSFVAYVLGFDIHWSTKDYPYLCDKGILQQISHNDIHGFQLMDIIYEDKHVAIITDIWRNEHGKILKVEISEAIHNNVVSYTYTIRQLMDRINQEQFISVYRYSNIINNITYIPYSFVSILDDPESNFQFNNDICTIGGDYASYKTNDPVFVTYTKGDYSSMEIYDEHSLVFTCELSNNTDDHFVNITDISLPEGLYKARLTNNNTHSDYTHFEIRDLQVKISGEINSLNVSYHCRNAFPLYVDIVNNQAYPIAMYVLSREDIVNGMCHINIPELETWDGSFSDDELFIKVAFKTEYGKLYSNPIKISI